MDCSTISIIMPVYNEINTILELLKRVQNEPHKKEIIIVDDGSSDGTQDVLRGIKDKNVTVLFHQTNKGKGNAIRTAIKHITGDICIIQDADLEYYPDEYTVLIEKIIQDKADVVYGTRFLGAHRVFLFYHHLGNAILNCIANIILNTNLTDLMTCYKAFKISALKKLDLHADGFGIEAEITAEVFKRKYRVYEVPISYEGRGYEEGKKIKWPDFFSCLYWLIRSWLRGIDVGTETLLRMKMMKNNNLWCYSKIKPFLGKKILEVGSGMGTTSHLLVAHGAETILSDINNDYIHYLTNWFIGNPRVKVIHLDILNTDNTLKKEHIDTIVGFNILEHINDDEKVLKNFFETLLPGGKILLIVPAHKTLYGTLDRALSHFRRYNKDELSQKLTAQSFIIEKIEYMNSLSAIGWFITYKILKMKRMSLTTIWIADKLIPFISFVEKYIHFPFGLSVLAIAKKPQE